LANHSVHEDGEDHAARDASVSFTFMKPKLIIAITLLTNLSLGNFLLPLGKGKYETVAGFVTVHLVISVIAIMLILYLFSLIKTSTKKIYVLSGPIIMSYWYH
jgi:hypothetical protein